MQSSTPNVRTVELIFGDKVDIYLNTLIPYRQWLKANPRILIKHCNRQFNLVADIMAKACRSMEVDCIVTRIFPTSPSYCSEQLTLDCNSFNIIS